MNKALCIRADWPQLWRFHLPSSLSRIIRDKLFYLAQKGCAHGTFGVSFLEQPGEVRCPPCLCLI